MLRNANKIHEDKKENPKKMWKRNVREIKEGKEKNGAAIVASANSDQVGGEARLGKCIRAQLQNEGIGCKPALQNKMKGEGAVNAYPGKDIDIRSEEKGEATSLGAAGEARLTAPIRRHESPGLELSGFGPATNTS
jgi:hypothetical protein